MQGITYWLRWAAVLPGAVVIGLLTTFPLHFMLYNSLREFVEPYPETPERLLTPAVIAAGVVWGGATIAPAYKFETAVVLFGLWMVLLGAVVALGQTAPGDWVMLQLVAPALAFVGGLVAVFIVYRKAGSTFRPSPNGGQ